MLSCFDLNPGEEIGTFQSAYAAFVDEMKRIDLVESTGPIGNRQRDTPRHFIASCSNTRGTQEQLRIRW
jgi:hypothetical protein